MNRTFTSAHDPYYLAAIGRQGRVVDKDYGCIAFGASTLEYKVEQEVSKTTAYDAGLLKSPWTPTLELGPC